MPPDASRPPGSSIPAAGPLGLPSMDRRCVGARMNVCNSRAKPSQATTRNRPPACWAQSAQRSRPRASAWHSAAYAAMRLAEAPNARGPSCRTSLAGQGGGTLRRLARFSLSFLDRVEFSSPIPWLRGREGRRALWGICAGHQVLRRQPLRIACARMPLSWLAAEPRAKTHWPARSPLGNPCGALSGKTRHPN